MNTRQIKFRAWDKRRKCFVNLSEFGSFIFPVDGGEKTIKLNHSDQVELMQYTGLKDKNGKEIYEGDIVQTTAGFIGEILFYDGAFMGNFEPMKGTEEGFEVVLTLKEVRNRRMEIIGNIYENPELLK